MFESAKLHAPQRLLSGFTGKNGLLTFTDAELKETVYRETGIRPPFAFDTFSDLEGEVKQSIARIHASPFVLHKDAIRGFTYEVETGRLREVE